MDRRKSRRIESKTIQWTEGKVVELKARQYNGQKENCIALLSILRLFLLSIVLPCFEFYDFFFCPLYCLAAIQWTEGKVVELKARQYNGQKEKS
jgi:hypothetical protein